MLYYRCPECSQESPVADDQAGRSVKCPHCGMLGMAYGVSIRRAPDAETPEIVVPPPPEPTPEPPGEPPLDLELPPELEALSGSEAPRRPPPAPGSAAPPEAPELEPLEPRVTTPDRQEVPVRRVEPYRAGRPPRPTHPAAIASVVLGVVGLVSFCCGGGVPFGVAAIATSLAALGQMSQSPGMYAAGGRGLAKTGLALGMIAFVLSLIMLWSWLGRGRL